MHMKDFDLNAFLKDLETIVNIDSGFYYAPGVTQVADFLTARYEALGLKVTRRYHEKDTEHVRPFLTVRNSKSETIDLLLIGHLDTVFPTGTAARRPFTMYPDGTGKGPGCIDCKGGLLIALYLVEYLVKNELLNFNLCVAMNADEENGSVYSADFIRELAQITGHCLVMEPGRKNGEYVKQRKGSAHFLIECEGISAHDGVNPQDGASATLELARWALALSELADEATGTTVNIGTLNGGSAYNIVADSASMNVHVRSFDAASLIAIKTRVAEMAQHPFNPRCRIRAHVQSERVPVVPSKETMKMIAMMEEAGIEAGHPVAAIQTGGGSDGSFFAEFGVPLMDGCGPKGANLHSEREYIDTTTVEARIDILLGLVKRLFPGK